MRESKNSKFTASFVYYISLNNLKLIQIRLWIFSYRLYDLAPPANANLVFPAVADCILARIYAGFPAGIFMALMFQSPELHSIDQRTDVSLMHKVREGFKMSFRKGWSQGKSFATLGIVFSSTECLLEKYRGKHDLWNSMVGGWIGGAVIAIRGGPTAVLSSMALMTGFTLAFDVLLGMRGYRPSSIFAAE